MDAVVLAPMPQTPAKAPGQSGQTAGRNDSSFGPVLSNAMAGSGTNRKTSPETTPRPNAPAESDQPIDIESIDELDELNAFLTANNLTLDELPRDLQEMIASAYGLPALIAGTDGTFAGQASQLPAGMLNFPHTTLPQGMAKFLEIQQVDGTPVFLPPAGLFARKEELPLILSQLQQIISANESGNTVVLQSPADPITLDELTGLTPRLLAGENQPQGNLAAKQAVAALPADTAAAAETAELARTAGHAQGSLAAKQAVAALPADMAAAAETAELARTTGHAQGSLAANQAVAALPADTAAAAETAELTRTAGHAAALPGQTGETETAPTTVSTTLRQEMQQATDAKAMLAAGDRDQTGGQTGKQENNAMAQQPATTVSGNIGSPAEQSGQSGIFSSVLQDSTGTQPTGSRGNTMTLPSGTMISEQEVVNQLMQRFQLTTRLQSSKINLRLHPAELGELKIDLTVKEGTIKASVFAQNQHVQEILERNMPKLRATLEQQGFTIDEIVVSFKSETSKDFDLFDGRSTRDQNFSFSGNARSHVATFESAFDTTLTGTASSNSGLSVRA